MCVKPAALLVIAVAMTTLSACQTTEPSNLPPAKAQLPPMEERR